MYENLAVIAVFAFFYSAIAGRIERTFVSGPMVFMGFGLALGPLGLGILDIEVGNADLRVLADLTLALVLFIDAANVDMAVLKRNIQIPRKMLALGLPLVILLGFGVAVVIFDNLSLFEMAILATMLAATDAALGKAVVTNEAVPDRVREALNAESGLNDGICVPILFVFIALAVGSNTEGSGVELALKLVAQEIGIGLVVGLGLTALGAWVLKQCWKRGWVTDIWGQIPVVALSMGCFATAQSLHGSGYIAAFVGGLLFGVLTRKDTHALVHAAEGIAETLALFTWVVFGAAVVGQSFAYFSWQIVLYSVLSLTLVRVLPIYLALTGTGEPRDCKLFLGWFGPRGLASIVFAIIVLNENLPGGNTLAMTVVCTVFLSVLAHGLSAKPMSKALAARHERGDGSN